MKSYIKLLTAACAASLITVSAFAADAKTMAAPAAAAATASSPTGSWKFMAAGRGGNAPTERTIKLALTDGKLTGALAGFEGPNGPIPEVAISDASFKDGAIAFSTSQEFNGNVRVTKYTGKLEGDTITGSTERPGRDGAIQKADWIAKRAK